MKPAHNAERSPSPASHSHSEDGFLLLGAIVAVALILLALSIAAPAVARELRREREVEAVHRGNQYVRAIQLYYRKFGHYPMSIDQLEKTSNIRFLRRRYADPITGKEDFRTIPVGQNKTTVKTFFGQPLAGVAGGGAGSVSSMLSAGIGGGSTIGSGGSTSALGSTGLGTPAASLGSPLAASSTSSATPTTGSGASAGAATTGSAGATGSTGTNDAAAAGSSTTSAGTAQPSVFTGGTLPFMGVGLGTKGDSIVEPNEQTTYETWEFLYDPRLDQLKAQAAALNGGSIGSVPSNSLGSSNSIFGNTGSTSPTSATPAGSSTGTPAPTATTTSNSGTQP